MFELKESRNEHHVYSYCTKKHPFINSPLGDYMDHLKGNRKLDGRSKLEDIKEGRRGEKQKYDYWKT